MSRKIAVSVALVILGLAAAPDVLAQARPNLAGTWVLNFDRSGPEVAGNGATLVITSHRSFSSPVGDTVVEFHEIWTLSGNALSVKKTMTQEGESQTATAMYDKGA